MLKVNYLTGGVFVWLHQCLFLFQAHICIVVRETSTQCLIFKRLLVNWKCPNSECPADSNFEFFSYQFIANLPGNTTEIIRFLKHRRILDFFWKKIDFFLIFQEVGIFPSAMAIFGLGVFWDFKNFGLGILSLDILGSGILGLCILGLVILGSVILGWGILGFLSCHQ